MVRAKRSLSYNYCHYMYITIRISFVVATNYKSIDSFATNMNSQYTADSDRMELCDPDSPGEVRA